MMEHVSVCYICRTWDPDVEGKHSRDCHCDTISDIKQDIHHSDDVLKYVSTFKSC